MDKINLIYEMSAEDIQKTIEQYLPIREEKKDQNGEVFTPESLINEMLDKLPKDVWKNKDYKWLDPANGIGNFPMIVYQKLMEGLKDVIKDDEERSNHIINNMLYMVELDIDNVNISKKIFGKDANIYCGDFLSMDIKKVTGVEKFDIIIGNPPFNKGQKYQDKKGGGDSLWDKFIIKSLELLSNNKFLVFVTPSGWRSPDSEHSKTKGLFDLMAHKNSIIYLEIHNTKDGLKTFNAATRYDFYIIKKQSNNRETIIKDEKGIINNLNLNNWNFLPNYNYNLIQKLLAKTDETINNIYSASQFETRKSWVSEKKTDKFKYPLVHSTPLSGIRYYYTSNKTPQVKELIPMFGISKVIFGDSGINNVLIDLEGNYGMTQHAIGIKVKNSKEAELYKKALESVEFKEVLDALSYSNYQINWRMFKYFKPDFYNIIFSLGGKK